MDAGAVVNDRPFVTDTHIVVESGALLVLDGDRRRGDPECRGGSLDPRRKAFPCWPSDVGGSRGRKVVFHTHDGSVLIRRL